MIFYCFFFISNVQDVPFVVLLAINQSFSKCPELFKERFTPMEKREMAPTERRVTLPTVIVVYFASFKMI